MFWCRAFSPSLLVVLLIACGDESVGDSVTFMSAAAAGTRGGSGAGSSAESAAGSAGTLGTDSALRTAATASVGGARASAAGAAASTGAAGDAAAGPTLEPLGPGTCCPDGKCLCRAEPPSTLSALPGPYNVLQYEIAGSGCVFYPTDAPPPFAAIALADGFGGSGGCDSVQSDEWGPLYASHGIVVMIIETFTGDQADARGEALLAAITTIKAEREKRESPLFGKLAGRYGTAGFSTGGGGSMFAAQMDATLLSSVAIMPWGLTETAGSVPTLIVCGDSDGVAPCSVYGEAAYADIESAVPKMRVTVASPHNGQPSAASGATGAHALAFQKLFLEGDERWRALLLSANADETTIK